VGLPSGLLSELPLKNAEQILLQGSAKPRTAEKRNGGELGEQGTCCGLWGSTFSYFKVWVWEKAFIFNTRSEHITTETLIQMETHPATDTHTSL